MSKFTKHSKITIWPQRMSLTHSLVCNLWWAVIFVFSQPNGNGTPPSDGNEIAASGPSKTWWMQTVIVLWGPQRRWSQTAFLNSSINDNGPFYTNVPNTTRRVTRITNAWERIVTIVNACMIVFDGTAFPSVDWTMEVQPQKKSNEIRTVELAPVHSDTVQ